MVLCVACFGVSFCTVWKELITRLAVCSHCVMSVFNLGCFAFWFRGRDFGSDCISVWSSLNFYYSITILDTGSELLFGSMRMPTLLNSL